MSYEETLNYFVKEAKKEIMNEIKKIYSACNDKRVSEIQNMLGNLLKRINDQNKILKNKREVKNA